MRSEPRLVDAPLPTLRAGRLMLRALVAADAPAIHAALQDAEVARNTLSIPWPYPPGAAEGFIAAEAAAWAAGKRATWGIVAADAQTPAAVCGVIGLVFRPMHRKAEVGYWLARGVWGRGYATAAVRLVVPWAFDAMGLHRLEAYHFAENPASGRVLAKAGFQCEGPRRGAVWRDDVPRDVVGYAMLREDPRP